jgi:hypothetical protein
MAQATKKCGQPELNPDGIQTPTDIFLADSWFSSVKTAEQMQLKFKSKFVGVVKTAHGRFPRHFLENKMKTWPAGSHLVLEGTTSTGVKLLSIGYKYNKKKVLCFICTADAGHTEPGQPYRAKWIGDNGEKFSKNVSRPDIIARYFGNCNVIDKHNHARQGILGMERQWVTLNGFFRFCTTMIAMTVTDCWKAYKFHLQGNHRLKNVSILKFADMLVFDLLNRVPFGDVTPNNLPQRFVPPTEIRPRQILNNTTDDDLSPLTERTGHSTRLARLSSVQREGISLSTGYLVQRDHVLCATDEKEKDGRTTRIKRRLCDMCYSERPKKSVKTKNICRTCRTPLCGTSCLIRHQNQVLQERQLSLYA